MMSRSNNRLGRATTMVVLGLLGIAALGTPPASAEPPIFNGLMPFPTIKGPEDPEEFPWKVTLHEEQELKLIDDQHAVVYWTGEGEHTAFSITAEPARDADGSAVPTSIALSEGNVVTLTVHHRAGNPAEAGAPFDYPITPGPSFTVGYSTVIVWLPAEAASPAPAQCLVPMVVGNSLKAARLKLANAGCKLGKVRGKRSKTARVVRQHREPGIALRDGAHVAVKLEG